MVDLLCFFGLSFPSRKGLMMSAELPRPTERSRVRLFLDYWNLQITLNERDASVRGTDPHDERFRIDFIALPRVLIAKATELIDAECAYEGAIVYTSYNSKTEQGRKFNKWATTWLDRQAGIQVNCYERQLKRPPTCNHCHKTIQQCRHCNESLAGTQEKGVDSAIVTDMIRLAWERAYDVAIVVSSDSDLVPAVKFLDLRGLKILQAGFPPLGSHLAKACWGSIDLFACREEYRRK